MGTGDEQHNTELHELEGCQHCRGLSIMHVMYTHGKEDYFLKKLKQASFTLHTESFFNGTMGNVKIYIQYTQKVMQMHIGV